MPVREEEMIDPVEVIPRDIEVRLVAREAGVERIEEYLEVPVEDLVVRCAVPQKRNPAIVRHGLPSSRVKSYRILQSGDSSSGIALR